MNKKKGPIRVSDLANTAKRSPKIIKRKKDFSSEQSAYGFVCKPGSLLSAETLGNICRKLGHELLKWESRLKQSLKEGEKEN